MVSSNGTQLCSAPSAVDVDDAQAGRPSAQVSSLSSLSRKQPTVTYHLRTGGLLHESVQSNSGALGRSREEALDLVKSQFTDLADIEDRRISFLTPFAGRSNNGWAIVEDDGWTALAERKPASIKIEISGMPTRAQRQVARAGVVFWICGITLKALATLFGGSQPVKFWIVPLGALPFMIALWQWRLV